MAGDGGYRFCRLLAPVMMFIFCKSFVCRPATALYVVGRTSTQMSSYSETTAAYKAVDGVPSSCTMTKAEMRPWWRMDLAGEYCIRTVTVVNRADCCAERLVGAVVRAGLNPTVTENDQCGSPVTADSATPGAWIQFPCDPPVQARYISVDIDLRGAGRKQYLTVCEVMVTEASTTECPEWTAKNETAFLDVACYTSTPLVDPSSDDAVFIGAYLGERDSATAVSFGRQSQTGQPGVPGLPANSFKVDHPSTATGASLLYMPQSGGINRLGAFYCLATNDNLETKVTMILLNGKDNVHVRPVTLTKTVSVVESVTLEMRPVNPPNTNWRWRHNGGPFIDRSHNSLSHYIPNACARDAGVYECHVNGERALLLHGIMKLIVRACPSGKWGPEFSCSKLCPSCYNGGVCDADSGQCVCAPGFRGRYCQEVLGRDVFGQDGSHHCSGSNNPHSNGCQGKLLCLPDPYGCSCAAGYKGLDCMQECDEGTYGADCKQTCHCALNVTCSKDTGECLGDCAPSYFGVNCQQTACPVGFFGAGCNQTCHCAKSATCHRDSGECEGPCDETYFGINCQQRAFDGVPDLVAHSSDTNPDHLILSWGRDSASFYTIAYELLNRGQCEPIISPQRVLAPDVLNRDTTHFILTGLEPSSSYKVYVQSHYGIHSVVATESFKEASTSHAQDPQVVRDVQAVNHTSDEFLVSWKPVQCATGYYLTYDLTQIGRCGELVSPQVAGHAFTTGNDTSIMITSVEPFATYRISILAVVSGANGSASTIQVVSAPGAPDPPNGLSLASSTAKTLQFTWNELPCDRQHGEFEGYRYSLREASTENTVASDITTVAGVGFAELSPCRTYEFSVASLASGIQGLYSNWLVAQTAQLEPGPVVNVSIIDVNPTEITVSWQPPEFEGCAVDEYKLRYVLNNRDGCSTEDRKLTKALRVPANTTLSVLTGLPSASQYVVFVEAVNAAGSGQAVSALGSTEESAPTSPPRDVIALASPSIGSLGFSWSQPHCGSRGGVITKFTYRLNDTDDKWERFKSAGNSSNEWVIFEDLEPNKEYSFQVAACTKAGIGPYSEGIVARAKPEKDSCTFPTVTTNKPVVTENQTVTSNNKTECCDRPANASADAVISSRDSAAPVGVIVAVFCTLLFVIAIIGLVRFRRDGCWRRPLFSGHIKWTSESQGESDTEIIAETDLTGM